MTDTLKQIREALEAVIGTDIESATCYPDECKECKYRKACAYLLAKQALQFLQGKVIVDEGRLREIVIESLCPMIPKDCNEDNDATCECCTTDDEIEERLAYLTKEDSDG